MTGGSRVIAYVRRSKPSGRTPEERAASEQKEEASITAQRRAIQLVCDFNHWTVADWKQDILSGKDMRRPGLREALDACDRGDVAAIMVATLDRLSRSSLDFELLMKRAAKRGWRIVVADGNIDLSTADGRFMARVLMNAAQHEREKTSERTSAALQVKKAQGVQLGRPSGISDAVRGEIMDMRRRGMTLAGIADRLNADGVPTSQGGDRWHPSTVKAILDADRVPA